MNWLQKLQPEMEIFNRAKNREYSSSKNYLSTRGSPNRKA